MIVLKLGNNGGFMKKQKSIDCQAQERKTFLKQANKIWHDFWKRICVKKDGTLDLDQIKLELADYHDVITSVSEVYAEITGGRLSKVTYSAETILSVYYDNINKQIDDAIEDYKKDHGIEDDADGEIISVYGNKIEL